MNITETHIVPVGVEKIRLQEYAVSVFKAAPTKSSIKKAIKRGEIHLDGKPANTGDWITPGQKIELLQKDEKRKIFRLKLEVLFEDQDMAVINKPSGYPTSGNYFKTIENALLFNLEPSTKPTALQVPKPVHRLDNPTSGLLLIAKTGFAQRKLHEDFENKNIQKEYTALVWGNFPNKKSLNLPIDEKPAETEVEPKKLIYNKEGEITMVSAFPKTGRTHQIRIHLASEGFPIIGDSRYGKIEKRISEGNLFLSATGLKFYHPVTQKLMEIALDLPKKFLKLTGKKSLT